MSNQPTAARSKKGFFSVIGGWIRRHKFLFSLLVFLLVAAIILVFVMNGRRRFIGNSQNTSYEFVRTVTLSRSSLDETVSTTGTVKSASTSTVSYSSSSGGMGSSLPTVKTVHVAVGDTVSAGDVIVSLDDSNIQSAIEDELEALEEKTANALESLEKAQSNYDDAYENYKQEKEDLSDAAAELRSSYSNYCAAADSIKSFEKVYNNALAAQEEAGFDRNSAKSKLITAQSEYQAAQAAADAAPENADLAEAAQKAADTLANAEAAWQQASEAYTAAAANTQAALGELNEAKSACNYNSYYSAYTSAENSYNSLYNQLESLSSKVDSTKEQLEQAQKTYDNSQTSSTLDDLYEQLENVQLKAETDGKITALNVGVGDTPNGVIATIQSIELLKITVTIQEADINTVAVGMSCRIESDATDKVISGTLSQLDPISSQGGTFGAEVTVDDKDTGLLIGVNASVEIIISSTEDCFSVPMDAIGNDNDGLGDYVLRATGGSGVDMTFEKVYVTTGESNDYYIEISADSLAEGDVIRASSDLTQGIESVGGDSSDGDMFSQGGIPGIGGMGNMGGGMNGSGSSGRPDFSGGNMPSGGAPSGGMPSGGGGFPG